MFFSTVTAGNSIKIDRDELLLMSDDCLADLCRIEAFVGTGPGGQHRNRNYTAVRVRLKNIDSIVAEESAFRSQKQNSENLKPPIAYNRLDGNTPEVVSEEERSAYDGF